MDTINRVMTNEKLQYRKEVAFINREKELAFLIEKGFINKIEGKYALTPSGYRNYHGIVPLFYSNRQKMHLLS